MRDTARRVGDVLADKASENFVGRREELAALAECLGDGGPLITWVYGIPGIGKSALLAEFRIRATATGAEVAALDGRFVEPTPEGFGRALGGEWTTASDRTKRQVLIIDSYELLPLLDAWLRQTFLPGLDDSVRVVLASRHPPSASWSLALEWQGLVRVLPLRELPAPDAMALLTRAGIGGREAERLNRLAHGNPLALRLALSTASTQLGNDPDSSVAQAIVQHMAGLFLESALDHDSRTALEAASVVNFFTRSLAQAMLPGAPPDIYDRLAGSWLVHATRHGLVPHDAVREAVSSHLRSSDPHRFQMYRQAAWVRLRQEARLASREQMWAYTSGIIFLLDNPVVREAFFPTTSQPVNVEGAGPGDRTAVYQLIQAHETPAAERILQAWWNQAAWAFRTVRNAVTGATSGFYVLAELRDKRLPRMEEDPLMREWRRHLRSQPIPPEQTAVFLRRWLSAEQGELPSPVQAACWLDAKRSYMEFRPNLRRCYLALCDLQTYGPAAKRLGFEIVEGASVTLDGVTHHLAVLDFGPGSVDTWLANLVGAELGVKTDGILDIESRELILDQQRVALTSLEFDLLRHLQDRAGKAVSRAELLEHVWRRRADSASNVVDVVVRCLRRKLGDRGQQLATVRGFGYRFDR
jgi:hypothetical protein